MNKYLIRFNRTRGQPGRGSPEYVWRIFENGVEHLVKHLDIETTSWSEGDGQDWNIACNGFMSIVDDKATISSSRNIPISPVRTCDGCTKCCEGYLSGEAHGHTFSPGKPCFFVSSTGCSIYENRPVDPCVKFKCLWKASDILPMWMRPDLSNVIMLFRKYDDGEWLEVTEAGAKIDSKVLSWILIWAANNKKNVRWSIEGGMHWVKNN